MAYVTKPALIPADFGFQVPQKKSTPKPKAPKKNPSKKPARKPVQKPVRKAVPKRKLPWKA